MKKHILYIVIGLVVAAALLLGAPALDAAIGMPLLGGEKAETPVPSGPETETEIDVDVQAGAAAREAGEVDAMIAALPNPVTPGDRASVAEARAAYNALSAEAKGFVLNLAALESAEAALQQLDEQPQPGEPQGETPEPTAPAGEFAVGAAVTFTGGDVYVSSHSNEASAQIDAASQCSVTYAAPGAAHPYHLISSDGGGVYGWVDAANIQENQGE